MGKLTLSVKDETIKAAKEWAEAHGLSVSHVVSTFFILLTKSKQTSNEMPPILRKLAGILEKEGVLVQDYHSHIKNKYL